MESDDELPDINTYASSSLQSSVKYRKPGLTKQPLAAQNPICLVSSSSDSDVCENYREINVLKKRATLKQPPSPAMSSASDDETETLFQRIKKASAPKIELISNNEVLTGNSVRYSPPSTSAVVPNLPHILDQVETTVPKKARAAALPKATHPNAVERLAREEERRQKKENKEREALLKRAERDARRNMMPKECMKLITVVLDSGLLQHAAGAAVLTALTASQCRHDVQPQQHHNVITFFREVYDVKDGGGCHVTVEASEVAQDQVLIYLPHQEFVELSQTTGGEGSLLRRYIEELQEFFAGREVTILLQQAPKGKAAGRRRRGSKTGGGGPQQACHQEAAKLVMMEAQLLTGCNFRHIESDMDLAKTVMEFAKAVAEKPFKSERAGRLEGGFRHFHAESARGVKVAANGVGLARVWRQQLQQFPNVSAEIASAVAAVYPSPASLWTAYQRCVSPREGEMLLQDIEVRRGYGVMETKRRVGKELSRRVWLLFTSSDPEVMVT